jgi:hypothetical protein
MQKKLARVRARLSFLRREAGVVRAEIRNAMPLILGNPFMPAADHADLIYILRSFQQIMEGTGLIYWLDCGTLLGAWRWGQPLPWDYDGDIGYLAGQYHLIAEQSSAFAARGIQLRSGTVTYNRVYVDLYPWIERDGFMVYTKHLDYETGFLKFVSDRRAVFPGAWINPLATIRFADEYFNCPNQVETLLRKRYGNINILVPYHLKTWLYPQFYRYYWIFAHYRPDIRPHDYPQEWTIVRNQKLLAKFGVTDETDA